METMVANLDRNFDEMRKYIQSADQSQPVGGVAANRSREEILEATDVVEG